ncbi:MAG: endopeptidase La [Spirochaetota bacterium]
MNMIQDNYRHDQIELPLIFSRELVVFPHSVIPYFSSSAEINEVIQQAMEGDRLLLLAYPNSSAQESEKLADRLHTVGTVVKILQIFKMKNNNVKLLIEALYRGRIESTNMAASQSGYAEITPIVEKKHPAENDIALLMKNVQQSFESYSSYIKGFPTEVSKKIQQADNGDTLVDLICTHVPFQRDIKLELLSITDTKQRLEHVSVLLETEIEMKKLQGTIQSRVKERLEQAQKEYFLNEQIRQINRELGKEQDEADEADELLQRIKAKNPPEEVLAKAEKEATRLRKLQAMAPESGVLRTYLEWLADLPWSHTTEDNYDIKRAQKILDEDHYNMVKPKERILDFLAVRSIQRSVKGPILCLVGPPGTGKTSLGMSVARTIGREFIRISLGGIRDEAEIRGHRKTYVGALPGKIIQSIKKAGTINPVFLLDEVDKMSADFRGDPASALLEVLDPEQNSTFSDHYLEVPFDLSQVLFIATANSLHTVPAALRDRMEIIEIPGYSDVEKFAIATQFLIPKQMKENGLDQAEVRFRKDAIMKIIHEYTMESGVRNLERSIGAVVRKTARAFVQQHTREQLPTSFKKVITAKAVPRLLGKPLYTGELVQREPAIGLANGLAWTEMGGRLLSVEVSLMPGSGKLILTGNLGEVMKESARISLTFIQSRADILNVDPQMFKEHDIHVHVPQGAIPKDGPSAGITLCGALFSAAAEIPLPHDYSMTGEITLTGRVLSVGGIKEKVLASYRHGIHKIILPAANKRDAMEDLPKNVREQLSIYYVETIEEVFSILFPDSSSSQRQKSPA